MFFNLKRFYYGAVKRQKLLLSILIVPYLYIVISAIIPDRFIVTQDIVIKDESPVASAVNPLGFKPFGEVKKDSDDFFKNQFDIGNSTRLIVSKYYEEFSSKTINDAIDNCSFVISDEIDKVQIRYDGKDLELGRILVSYYSDRIVVKAQEGLYRSRNQEGDELKTYIDGDLHIEKLRSIWRSDRLTPLIFSISISIFIVFSLLCFLEWSDPSLKSERQVARYTGLPILGAVPDLNKISKKIQNETDIS